MKKVVKRISIILLILVVVIAAAAGIWYYLGIRMPSGTTLANADSRETIVETQDITFRNEDTGLSLAGIVFTPADFDSTKQYPAMVITGPMLSVKEQAQSVYAERLAEQGYVALVFDFSHFGESEGEPRQLEDPYLHNSDISSAVAHLQSLEYVDSERIGGMGMCGSGSYMPMAAIEESGIKAVVSLVPAISDMSQSIMIPLDEVEENKRAVEAGEAEPTFMNMMPRLFAEGAAYYYNSDRGAVPGWNNSAISWSELSWEGYVPAESIKELNAPYLVVTGENAWTRATAETLYNNATTEKQLYMVDDARHFDMYDLDPYVTEAVEQIVAFLNQHL